MANERILQELVSNSENIIICKIQLRWPYKEATRNSLVE